MPRRPTDPVTYLAVDPGKKGGFALIIDGLLSLKQMPEDDQELLQLCKDIHTQASISGKKLVAVLEKVGAMPGQGSHSMFSFGEGYGKLKMALRAARIIYNLVPPQTWHRLMNVPVQKKSRTTRMVNTRRGERVFRSVRSKKQREGKKVVHRMVQRIFPAIQITLELADAAMMVEYCRRKYLNKL